MICAALTDARDGEADRDGRADALIEKVGLEINLAVGDRDDVGGDVGGNVAGLRFDDRQRGERAVAVFFAETRRALEQAAVEIKHVARIGFAAGGPLEDERNLAVGDGVLGQIVVDDQGIHAVVHEPLAHGRPGERREVLVGGRVGGGRRDDDGVGEGAGLIENAR